MKDYEAIERVRKEAEENAATAAPAETVASEEEHYSTGAIVDEPDARDFEWGREIGSVATPFDWNLGYDIESEIGKALGQDGFKLFVDDQNGSGSCGGQAIHKKGESVAAIHNKEYVRKSAKFPYAQVFVPPAGSAARPLFDIYHNQGMGNEADTPSYDNGNAPSEAFMERVSDISQVARDNAKKDRSSAYAQVSRDIDSVAQAIRDSQGVILGIYGSNNGTWRTKFPIRPATGDVWAHWVYAGKAVVINGKKYIGFINSWGSSTGEQGWQYISEDYLTAQFGIFAIWTFVYDTHPGTDALFTRTLRFKSVGDDVRHLQLLLGINADGIFGKNTLAAVKQFQSEHGLVSDGIVGPKTQQALSESTS